MNFTLSRRVHDILTKEYTSAINKGNMKTRYHAQITSKPLDERREEEIASRKK